MALNAELVLTLVDRCCDAAKRGLSMEITYHALKISAVRASPLSPGIARSAVDTQGVASTTTRQGTSVCPTVPTLKRQGRRYRRSKRGKKKKTSKQDTQLQDGPERPPVDSIRLKRRERNRKRRGRKRDKLNELITEKLAIIDDYNAYKDQVLDAHLNRGGESSKQPAPPQVVTRPGVGASPSIGGLEGIGTVLYVPPKLEGASETDVTPVPIPAPTVQAIADAIETGNADILTNYEYIYFYKDHKELVDKLLAQKRTAWSKSGAALGVVSTLSPILVSKGLDFYLDTFKRVPVPVQQKLLDSIIRYVPYGAGSIVKYGAKALGYG